MNQICDLNHLWQCEENNDLINDFHKDLEEIRKKTNITTNWEIYYPKTGEERLTSFGREDLGIQVNKRRKVNKCKRNKGTEKPKKKGI